MNQFIATTLRGAEPLLKEELSSYQTESNQYPYFCEFESSEKQLLKFAYFSQFAQRICIKRGESNIRDIEIPSSIKGEFHPQIIAEKEHESRIRSDLEKSGRINYKTEKVIVIIQQQDKLIWAEDIFSHDFSKRDYKVFISPRTINPIIGAALAHLSEANPDYRIFDPFCNDGVVIIETALYLLHRSPNFYRKHIFDNEFFNFNTEKFLKELDRGEKKLKLNLIASDIHSGSLAYTRKNAKIAGIQKNIQISRKELEWIDIEFYKKPIHRVISYPKPYSKKLNQFYRYLKECLAEEGFLIYAIDNQSLPLEDQGFGIKEKGEIWQGKKKIKIIKVKPTS